jgi:hypothetical protein
VTWDCGYAEPTAAMQYTGSSFAEPLTRLFSPLLAPETRLSGVEGYFPERGAFRTLSPDRFLERLYRPLFHGVLSLLRRFAWIQNGRVQVYILYITVTLIVLLIGGLL